MSEHGPNKHRHQSGKLATRRRRSAWKKLAQRKQYKKAFEQLHKKETT